MAAAQKNPAINDAAWGLMADISGLADDLSLDEMRRPGAERKP